MSIEPVKDPAACPLPQVAGLLLQDDLNAMVKTLMNGLIVETTADGKQRALDTVLRMLVTDEWYAQAREGFGWEVPDGQ